MLKKLVNKILECMKNYIPVIEYVVPDGPYEDIKVIQGDGVATVYSNLNNVLYAELLEKGKRRYN